MLRADRHSDAARLSVRICVLASRLDPRAGMRLEPSEDEAFVLHGVLHARLAQVVEDHLLELNGGVSLPFSLGYWAFLVGCEDAMRREAFDGERAGDSDAFV